MKKSAKRKKSAKVKRGAKPKAVLKIKRGPSAKAKRGGKKRRGGKRGVRLSLEKFYATSQRLGFRLLEAADKELYCGLFTDAETMQHVCPPLSRERAERSFQKALEVTQVKPLKQHITVIVELASGEPLGISSLKWVDAQKRIAEGGMLLKPTAHAQRFASEAITALNAEAFAWHPIEVLTAQVGVDHEAGQRLVTAYGYTQGEATEACEGGPAMKAWSITREAWAGNRK